MLALSNFFTSLPFINSELSISRSSFHSLYPYVFGKVVANFVIILPSLSFIKPVTFLFFASGNGLFANETFGFVTGK